ncbi:TIGR03086 family metal-binding protein [Gordonia sp. CPCC 206044]|uniref:TIGR03086 family metal-binding protein n=1 Tax=Gordonia sp. CPCC 206044 TaxID=3140793 RepID=UPI003AF3A06A
MTYTALDLYDEGLDFFTEIVDRTPTSAWAAASPCAGWTGLDVLGHLCDATSAGARILRGETFEFVAHDPPSTAVRGEPAEHWHQLAEAARAAAASVDDLDRIVESPLGTRTVAEGLSFPAADLFLHGWDLATTAGRTVSFPEQATTFMNRLFDTLPAEVIRQPGVFGPAVTPPTDATPTEQLIGRCGRQPRRGTASGHTGRVP